MTRDRGERRDERLIASCFGLSALAAIALGVVYARGGDPQAEGALLFGALGALGAGLVVWGHRLLPPGDETQERVPVVVGIEREGFEDDWERGGEVSRRTLVTRSLSGALVALGGAALFPLRSLGPRPGRALLQTPWRAGRRLVTEDGTPVRAADVPVEGLVTVFPDGHPGSADGQAVLVRVRADLLDETRGREGWTPDGFIAFSKICTHAGCPVGLYQAETHALLCPCHQSAFDVLHGARPFTGPAAAPLPQLPLRIDEGGYLVAGGDFSEPVGPVFWRHR